jgi:hypothetical protein
MSLKAERYFVNLGVSFSSTSAFAKEFLGEFVLCLYFN